MNLDELRNATSPQTPEENDDIFLFDETPTEQRFLGMTAVERMFLSIFLFMNVCVLGLALLLATGRLVF